MKTSFLYFLMMLSLLATAEEKPNVLYIIVDQHSGLVMNQTGYPHAATPGIDKLASDGVLFTRSYCSYPVCTSARKTFQTGVMPSQAADVTTLPSIGQKFKDDGYETVFYGKWHVGSTHMDDAGVLEWHGFDTYSDERDDTDIYGLSSAFLKSQHDKPFFMMTSFLNPHDCCELARNIAGETDNYHDGAVEENADTALCPKLPSNFAVPPNEAEGFYARRDQDPGDKYWDSMPNKLWTEVEWRQYIYGYDRLVEKVDAHVENLYDDLVNAGLLDNTIIVYTSDHGDGHGSHAWTQKKSFYEESVNVPLIISWKGKTHKALIDRETLTSGLDIYPTILELVGISAASDLPGEDLSPVLLADATDTIIERDYVVSEMNQKVYKGNTPGTFVGRVVITQDYKYILFDKGVNREQLFDLKNDPGELLPLSDNTAYQNVIADNRAKLKEWESSTGGDFKVDEIIADYESNSLLDAVLVDGEKISNFKPTLDQQVLTLSIEEGMTFDATPVNSAAKVSIVQPSHLLGDEADRILTITVTSEDESSTTVYNLSLNDKVQSIEIGFIDNGSNVPFDDWSYKLGLISEKIGGPENHGLYVGDGAYKFVRGQVDKAGYFKTSFYDDLDSISFWLYVADPDANIAANLKIETLTASGVTTEIAMISSTELSSTEWREFKLPITTNASTQIIFTPSLPTDGDTRLWMDDMTLSFRNKEATGVNSVSSEYGISLFPNPCGNVLNIKDVERGPLTIYDMTGEPMLYSQMYTSAGAIDISSLDDGYYVIEVQGKNTYTEKFIKR